MTARYGKIHTADRPMSNTWRVSAFVPVQGRRGVRQWDPLLEYDAISGA
jgi:hypothetical protein